MSNVISYNLRIIRIIHGIFSAQNGQKNRNIQPEPEKQHSYIKKECTGYYLILLILRYWQTRTHCCGHIVADAKVSPFARARNICCGHNFVSGTQKMFLILFRTTLCPQQMFPSLRAQGNVMNNNVSATMFPRLQPPLGRVRLGYSGIRIYSGYSAPGSRIAGMEICIGTFLNILVTQDSKT